MEADQAAGLLKEHERAWVETGKYPGNKSKWRKLEACKKKLFEAMVGRKPTDEEYEKCSW